MKESCQSAATTHQARTAESCGKAQRDGENVEHRRKINCCVRLVRLTELTQDGQTNFVELVFLLNAATRDRDDYTDERLWQLAGVDLHEFAHESDGVHPLNFVVDVDVQRPAA